MAFNGSFTFADPSDVNCPDPNRPEHNSVSNQLNGYNSKHRANKNLFLVSGIDRQYFANVL